jgi:hypothetical protein
MLTLRLVGLESPAVMQQALVVGNLYLQLRRLRLVSRSIH